MTISIVNHTQLERQNIQDVLRAVNRQLREDFHRYWHKDVRLRLEGWAGENPDEKMPFDMRGDAVLYLWDGEDVENALGYHSLNNRGVPFGFVFTRLSERIGEPWSVTLSHEALEMAMDAEVNLLSAGPHPNPEENGRIVYHWYELCDAVQDDHYDIDGVAVSNFVLPLYFTVDDEHDNHNDFLGTRIASFGVNPGGYVGFWDPDTNSHETYQRPDDPRAVERMKAVSRFGAAKRLERHRHTNHGQSLRALREARCEAIVFEIRRLADAGSPPESLAQELVTRVLGDAWFVKECSSDPLEFDAIYKGPRRFSFAEAWDRAHQMAAQPAVVYAEPSFGFPIASETDVTPAERRRSSVGSDPYKQGTDNKLWSIEQCKVPEAWAFLQKKNKQPGAGVRIGHPDSGYLPHDEMDADRVLCGADWDFVDDDPDTRAANGDHGLATASVIMSGKSGQIQGPALHSKLLPMRVTKPGIGRPAPVLIHRGMHRLRDAIDHAVKRDCRVISISLGGLPHSAVHKAIRRAVRRGTIVLAAAGNHVGVVVWPARYREVIAVAGCDIEGRPWAGSCRGRAVDITAPAENVWRATLSEEGQSTVMPSHGTSYAVAIAAGVAALWLSAHEETLRDTVGREVVAEVFRWTLKRTADPSPWLAPDKFGAGIVNALEVLKAELKMAGPLESDRGELRRALQDHHLEQSLEIELDGLEDGLIAELACAEALGAFSTNVDARSVGRGRRVARRRNFGGFSAQLRRALGRAEG